MRIAIPFTEQQAELLDASVDAGEAPDRPSLAKLALVESDSGVLRRPHPRPSGRPWRWDAGLAPDEDRATVARHVLEPGTGRALEVHAGQILRVEQIDGDQCVDLNVFNLHDYKEAMHVGRTRTLHGVNPTAGDFLWSAPPRERPLMHILTDTAGVNDTLFPRCSANMYDSIHGFSSHTNCADIQAEAQREYGLTPDDVHDSFNLFMATRVVDGRPEILRQHTPPGSCVELLALVDVLAVPNVCGNDMFSTSNFAMRPVLVEVVDASRDDVARVPPVRAYDTQRTPAQFRQPHIRTQRELRRDPSYVAEFARTPVGTVEVVVVLESAEAEAFRRLQDTGRYATAGEALRDIVMTWWGLSHA